MTVPSPLRGTLLPMHENLTSDQAMSTAAGTRAISCPSCGRATTVVSGYIEAHPTYTSIYCLASDLQAPSSTRDIQV